MNINGLLHEWETHYRPDKVLMPVQVDLPLKHVARIKALAEIYTGRSEQQIIADLLSVALEELEATLPYVQGKRVIAEDEFGDPIYVDEGSTPRFLELTRNFYKQLAGEFSETEKQ